MNQHALLLAQLRRARASIGVGGAGGDTWPSALFPQTPATRDDIEAWLHCQLQESIRRKSARWGIDFASDPDERIFEIGPCQGH